MLVPHGSLLQLQLALLLLKHTVPKQYSFSFIRLLTPASMCADTRAWEVDTLRGHVNNVSCVMFHARQVSESHKSHIRPSKVKEHMSMVSEQSFACAVPHNCSVLPAL